MKAIFCGLAMAVLSGVTCIGLAVGYESAPEKYQTSAVGWSVFVAGYAVCVAMLIAAVNIYDTLKEQG